MPTISIVIQRDGGVVEREYPDVSLKIWVVRVRLALVWFLGSVLLGKEIVAW